MIEKTDKPDTLFSAETTERLADIYGCSVNETPALAERLHSLAMGFRREFPDNSAKVRFYSAPGRTEIGGNHTDHQLGCVIAGSVNADTAAAAASNGTRIVHLYSEGFGMSEVDLSDLSVHEEEKERTAALIRGMAAEIAERGFQTAGFDAYVTSSVPGGGGMSSSAAFEILIGVILNHLFCGDAIDAKELAVMAQRTENQYFGKPSGLMDQMASSVGGLVAIDFAHQDHPQIRKIDPAPLTNDYALVLIDTKSSHSDLTDAYAAIPAEMRQVASLFRQPVLRGITEEQLLARAGEIREQCGDRAFLRAVHFVKENARAAREADALERGDVSSFLKLVRESGFSSYMYLQNTAVSGSILHQNVNTALAVCDLVLGERGAFRVHGGGFAGTVQAFVPKACLSEFVWKTEQAIGEGTCLILQIRPVGGTLIV